MTSAKDKKTGPLFVVIEGIDGSGSTTLGDRMTAWLRQNGHRAYFTHEPSGGPAGMIIRLALSRRLRGASGDLHAKGHNESTKPSDLDPYTLALLYAADRMDHVATELVPNLRSDRIVICDRYLLSTLAYQSMSVDADWLFELNRYAPAPDVCIYLDIPAEYAKERMQRTRWTRDLYEEEDKLRQIRENYLALIANPRPEYGPIISIDATRSADTVWKKVRSTVQALFDTPAASRTEQNLSLFDWPSK